jgi:hypothetical protein
MSAIDQIRQAFPELANASDSEVLGEAARRSGASVGQISDMLGIAPSGTASEVGRQLGAGFAVDLPRTIGQALKYYGDAGGQRVGEGAFPRLGRPTGLERQYGVQVSEPDAMYRAGQSLVAGAEQRAPGWEADMRDRGLVSEALVSGARAIGPMAPVLGAAFLPGGQAVSSALASGLFGGSSAQDTYEKLIEQGIPEAEAAAAARRVWAVQGVGEGIATAGLGAAFRPAMAAVRGAPTTERIAKAATDTGVIRPFAKGMAVNTAVQAGTEAGQDVGTALVERAYGAKEEDLGAIARQSALGGAGLSLLLGPLSFGGHVSRARNAARLKEALYGESTPPEVRAQAMDMVMAEAQRQGVAAQDVDKWFDTQLDMEDARTEKLREIEQAEGDKYRELTKGITTEAEPIDLQARIDSLLGITPVQERTREIDLIGGARAPAEDYISGQRGLLTSSEQLQQVETGAEIAPGIIQSAPGVYYQQPTAPVDLTAPGRETTSRAYGVQGITTKGDGVYEVQPQQPRPTLSQIRTGMFQTPILNSQQVLAQEEGGPLAAGPAVAPAAPVTQVSPPPGAASAVSPVTPVVAGASLKAPKRGPKTPQAKQTKAQGQAPAAVSVAPAAVAEGEEADIAQTQQAIDELGLRPLVGGEAENLNASVQGGRISVGGRPTFTAKVLGAARDAFLTGKKSRDEQGGKLAQAARAFGEAYAKYLNAAGNMVPSESRTTLKSTKKFPQKGEQAQAEARAGENVANVEKLWSEAQTALTALGQAAGNSAKNVEALIRLNKDKIAAQKQALQDQMDALGEEDGEQAMEIATEIKALEKLDLGLSQGWAAAKRGTFREGKDVLDVRGGEVRTSKEEKQQGFEQPLVRAAKYGHSVNKFTKAETGFQGVLNYIRSSGTPFERMIAKAVSEVFKNTKNPPKIVFAEGKSQFDPKNNTVTMSPTASPEVALHEALHAALQWFVHSFPKDPIVRQLVKSVNQVVKYDSSKLSEKAAEVQKVLAELVAGKRELDAVLELISYGNTLVEFRKALEAMPSKGTPQSFVQAAKDVWNMMLATVRRMLGTNNTAASDVLMGSFRLLQQAAETQPTGKATGQVLEAAVQSTKKTDNSAKAAALGVPETDYTKWVDTNLVNVFSTQRVFEAIGWSKEGVVGKTADKLAEWARKTAKDYPGAEIVAGLLNSRYNVNRDVSDIQDNYKYDKNVGYQVAERIANYIVSKPAAEVNAVFDYLDGNKRALDGLDDGGKLKGLADNMKRWFDLYVSELSPIEQQFFRTRKFSENLLFPGKTEEVARNQFGLGKINAVLGKKSVNENDLDMDWVTKDANGDAIIDGDFFQVFKTANTVTGTPESAGFMSAARFAEMGKDPVGFSVDTTRKWILESGDADKGKYKFTTNTTAREKIADEKADDLANALRNTMAALANNYASKNFIGALAKMGKEGSPHAQVAFDSIDEINKEFGTKVHEDQVLSVSLEMARSEKTKDLYRMSGTWVQMPKSDVYGELAGKYIPGPVWNAMTDMIDRQPAIKVRAINNTMRWFKKSKTTLNPGTHLTNAASNITMAMMHDISFRPNTLNKQERVMVEQFINSGAMLGDFSSAEVKEALYKAHEANVRGGNDDSLLTRVAGHLGIEKSKAEFLAKNVGKADDFMSQMYAFEDNAFRMAAFMKSVGQEQLKAGGKAPTDEMFRTAGKFALKAFGDYDIDSKAVKVARQTVLPFVSWGYAMGPMIGRMALTQPWKIANVLMAYYILEAAMAGASGDDDEETRKSGPESIRERMFFGSVGPYMHVRIPFMGDAENPVYYKLGDYFPAASLTKGLPNGFAGQSWIPGMVTPSGPFVSAIASLVLGVDTYTGKSIHQPTDTEWQKLWNSTKAAYDIVSPPGISSRQLSRATDVIEGKTGITGAEPSSLVFARAFGLKLYDYNVTEAEAVQELAAKRVEKEFKSAMTKAKRDEYRKGYPDYEALDKELDSLRERMDEEIAKKRGEEL